MRMTLPTDCDIDYEERLLAARRRRREAERRNAELLRERSRLIEDIKRIDRQLEKG